MGGRAARGDSVTAVVRVGVGLEGDHETVVGPADRRRRIGVGGSVDLEAAALEARAALEVEDLRHHRQTAAATTALVRRPPCRRPPRRRVRQVRQVRRIRPRHDELRGSAAPVPGRGLALRLRAGTVGTVVDAEHHPGGFPALEVDRHLGSVDPVRDLVRVFALGLRRPQVSPAAALVPVLHHLDPRGRTARVVEGDLVEVADPRPGVDRHHRHPAPRPGHRVAADGRSRRRGRDRVSGKSPGGVDGGPVEPQDDLGMAGERRDRDAVDHSAVGGEQLEEGR